MAETGARPEGPGFADLLTLERVEDDIFRGRCHEGTPLRAFGGQVAAQALVAAGSTVAEPRRVHSLHSYFLRGGSTEEPIVYLVDRTRDGRSFSTRRVSAVQHGEVIFTLSASFQGPEDGVEHQARMPVAPLPEGGPPEPPASPRTGRTSTLGLVLDIREVPHDGDPADQRLWVRTRDKLDDDPLRHVCALTYISDLRLASTVALPHREGGPYALTSLDHALWFHRGFRADEWLLFAQHSPTASGARGLAMGSFFTEDGRQVATVVQEALIRPAKPGRAAF